MKKKKPYVPKYDIDQIKELRDSDRSIGEIAKIMDIPPKRLSNFIYSLAIRKGIYL